MKSIAFPKIFNRTSVNLVHDYDATLQNLKLLLWSEKGELFGDPYYGTGVKRYLFDQNDIILQDILLDDIYSAIVLFMPQLKVDRKNIKLIKGNKGELSIRIEALNRADYQTNLYEIVLLQAQS